MLFKEVKAFFQQKIKNYLLSSRRIIVICAEALQLDMS